MEGRRGARADVNNDDSADKQVLQAPDIEGGVADANKDPAIGQIQVSQIILMSFGVDYPRFAPLMPTS